MGIPSSFLRLFSIDLHPIFPLRPHRVSLNLPVKGLREPVDQVAYLPGEATEAGAPADLLLIARSEAGEADSPLNHGPKPAVTPRNRDSLTLFP